MGTHLSRITLRGFKTIRELLDFEPGPLTVLIGPNGAGKTNFISFFRMLSWALAPPGGLQQHVAELGGASAVLHDGPARTREIEAALTLTTDAGVNEYAFRLFHAAGDTLVFADEKYRFSRTGWPSTAPWISLEAGHREPKLIAKAEDPTARAILGMLRRMIVHQFHNTSSTARVRSKWDVADGRWLKEDAGNLAPSCIGCSSRSLRTTDVLWTPFAPSCPSSPTSSWSRIVAGCYCSGANGTPTWFSAPPRPPMEWSA